MRAGTLGLLVALGTAAVAGGWYFGTRTTPAERTSVAAGSLMFPDLTPRLKDIAAVEITHQGKQTVIEKRSGGGWGIQSMNDYPVQEVKLRGLLTGLTELRLSEPRTSDPTQFSRLGVDDPNAPGNAADLLRVLDGEGKPIAALITGHRRVRSQGNGPDELYVRRPGDNQSWLAEGNLQVEADPNQWIDRDIINIGHDRIARVTAGDLEFGWVDGKFALSRPADHPKLEDYKVDDVSRGLETLTLQAVKPDADQLDLPAGQGVFTTRDGVAVTITLFHAGKDVWIRLRASGPEAVKAEIDRLNGRLAGWTYQIGAWKEQSLVPTIDALKAGDQAQPTGGAK